MLPNSNDMLNSLRRKHVATVKANEGSKGPGEEITNGALKLSGSGMMYSAEEEIKDNDNGSKTIKLEAWARH